MARKTDSGWRDEALNEWHVRNGFPCPAAGMVLPMIEYDRGQSVGLVNYVRRGENLPSGPDVAGMYRAFGDLHNDTGGKPLPFLTAAYDPRNWAMKVFPHNEAARSLMGTQGLAPHWVAVTEHHFAAQLFAMRGRSLPDMFGYGVEWSTAPWMADNLEASRHEQPFPGADISARRRAYEPVVSAPMRVKLPCLDIDLAIADRDDKLSLVVDYKRPNATCDVKGTNATALASLARPVGPPVAAMMTRYWGDDRNGRYFEAWPLNRSASRHLSYTLGAVDARPDVLAKAVAGDHWVRLTEDEWLSVLKVAKEL